MTEARSTLRPIALDPLGASDKADRAPLCDSLGRVHSSLRISVTDRCNIRCFYCMPVENVRFKPRAEILSFEEIERFVRALTPLGIDRLRITGGEPLVRAELPELVRRLAQVDGIRDLAMTTNGVLLAEQAEALARAGLQRINVSLDAMSEATFQRIARRPGLQRVLDGIATAQRVGFRRIRLNAVAIRGLTEVEAVPLARFARDHQLELRFIEFMPLDAEGNWQSDQVLDGESLRKLLQQQVAPMRPCPRPDPSQPAFDYEYVDGSGRVGFINPVTAPFCHTCNRLRLTADGKLRNCLFSTVEWDARAVLRDGGNEAELRRLVRDCVWHKKPAHGIDLPDFQRPERAMYQIGG
jgi:cyclic pyranopterin phosphate synthase